MAVRAARVGVTGGRDHRFGGRDGLTGGEGVASVASIAGAYGVVVSHRALGVAATCSRAWISAFLLDTGQAIGTLGVDETCGTTTNIGIADVFRYACARSSVVSHPALGIGSTGRWVAWINDWRICNN